MLPFGKLLKTSRFHTCLWDDDEPSGDVAQAQVLLAQMQGHGQHGLVRDGGTADGFAATAGGLVAFQGPGRRCTHVPSPKVRPAR
jgi:hypothetical protein